MTPWTAEPLSPDSGSHLPDLPQQKHPTPDITHLGETVLYIQLLDLAKGVFREGGH